MNFKQSIIIILIIKNLKSSLETSKTKIALIPKITNILPPLITKNSNKIDNTLYTLKIQCNSLIKSNLRFLEKAVNLCFENEMVFSFAKLYDFLKNIKVKVLDYNFDKYMFIDFSIMYYEKSRKKNLSFRQGFKILKKLPILIKDQSINYDSENDNDTKKIGSFEKKYLEFTNINDFEIISSNKPNWVKFEFEKNDLFLVIDKNPSKDVFTNFSFKIKDNSTNLESSEVIINLNNENPNDLKIFVRKIEILLCLVFIIFLLFFLILLTITKFENIEEKTNKPEQKIEIITGNVLSNSILNWSKKSKSTMVDNIDSIINDKEYEKLDYEKREIESKDNSIIDIGDKISVISKNDNISRISFFDGINFK